MSADRRKFLETATAMTAGAVAGCTLPTTARDDGGMMFRVEPTFIPLAGSGQKFPVRRIYCVGRNYAAHSREMARTRRASRRSFSRNPRTQSSSCRRA